MRSTTGQSVSMAKRKNYSTGKAALDVGGPKNFPHTPLPRPQQDWPEEGGQQSEP